MSPDCVFGRGEPVGDVDRLLDGLHEWRDVQTVVRTTFQALYDVAHAQTQAVRDVERRLGDMQEELVAVVARKADATALRPVEAAAEDAKATAEFIARRVDEESQCAADSQKATHEDMQALRNGLSELRLAVEKQRSESQQWRAGIEAGLAQLASEYEGLADVAELRAAIEEKATPAQLRQIVDEAWQRKDGQLARLHRLCESKVSTAEFAQLAALADGKVSMGDLEGAVKRQVGQRLNTLVTEQQLVAKSDAAGIAEASCKDARERVRTCEHRLEELARQQQRAKEASEELRAELRLLDAYKLGRPETEALIAGALSDWVRAAHRGADVVNSMLQRTKQQRQEETWTTSPPGAWNAISPAGGFDDTPARFPSPVQVQTPERGRPERVRSISREPISSSGRGGGLVEARRRLKAAQQHQQLQPRSSMDEPRPLPHPASRPPSASRLVDAYGGRSRSPSPNSRSMWDAAGAFVPSSGASGMSESSGFGRSASVGALRPMGKLRTGMSQDAAARWLASATPSVSIQRGGVQVA
eukprot:TRINITY_DN21536_c0_g1_i2.p1 TRINITY_DN21536_c0_g1~~TRINITY_DN21536_c0_g1_i2.p1  ORF type:complete len:531 (-),score=136.81 TRINITY_DN21536_c0_g1_i2:158-1750(-)